MGLGSVQNVNLTEARAKAAKYRSMASDGVDPIATRRIEPRRFTDFTTCAARYIRAQRHRWRSSKHARQWVCTLKTYARPVIGPKSVDVIATEVIVKILSPIWTTKTETAKRLQGRIENVLNFVAAHNFRDPLNPARWRGHLDKLLPRPSRASTVTHHPAMPYTDLPVFMEELRQNDSISSLALQFLILTTTRTSEVLRAEWSEIDQATKVWTIPANRMKTQKQHRVTLTGATIKILGMLPRIDHNPFVFPGSRTGRPLSNMAMLQLMRGMGFGVNGSRGPFVPHGSRSSFRDWSGEVSSFPRDVAEMALAHVVDTKVEAAYRRGDLFEKRTRMMEKWASFLAANIQDQALVQLISADAQSPA